MCVDRELDSLRIGYSKVISDNLNANLTSKVLPTLMIILIKRVLDRNHFKDERLEVPGYFEINSTR